MGEVDLVEVRKRHVFDPDWNLDECEVDEETLPCTTLQLAAEIERLRADLEEAAGFIHELLDAGDNLYDSLRIFDPSIPPLEDDTEPPPTDPEHRCGVQGFDGMRGDVCPACATPTDPELPQGQNEGGKCL
jgi:hypothetical protein